MSWPSFSIPCGVLLILLPACHTFCRYSNINTRPGSAPPDVPDGPPCPGIPIFWPPELDPYDTFPWSRLGPTAGLEQFPFSISIQDQGSRFLAHSRQCTGVVHHVSVPCLECQSMSPRIERVVSAARSGIVPHKFIHFSPQQRRERLRERMDALNAWKLKVCVLYFLTFESL